MNIRLITTSDAALLAEYYLTNAEHFRPWEPIRDDNSKLFEQSFDKYQPALAIKPDKHEALYN